MTGNVTLHGYRFSVYNRIARAALHAKNVAFDTVEVDPFSPLDPAYLALNPFGRVPTLTQGDFAVFETAAITRYVDNAFDGPSLQPSAVQVLARMDQVIAVLDSYGYWPMVRQVFAQAVFRPLTGEPSDPAEVIAGIEASHKVLGFLNDIAQEGLVLDGQTVTLADCHLAPMMDYFARAEQGLEALKTYPALHHWWGRVSQMEMVKLTAPNLSKV